MPEVISAQSHSLSSTEMECPKSRNKFSGRMEEVEEGILDHLVIYGMAPGTSY